MLPFISDNVFLATNGTKNYDSKCVTEATEYTEKRQLIVFVNYLQLPLVGESVASLAREMFNKGVGSSPCAPWPP
jgi:hypothetical protein